MAFVTNARVFCTDYALTLFLTNLLRNFVAHMHMQKRPFQRIFVNNKMLNTPKIEIIAKTMDMIVYYGRLTIVIFAALFRPQLID